MKTILMALLLVIVSLRPAVAGNAAKPWIGHRFQPEQCVAIRDGQATFQRKLCRIDYSMKQMADGVHIEGHLTFNPRFVPRPPKVVDLEVLLIDREFVCIGQIDITREVDTPPVHFVIRVPSGSNASYLRTYYTLHYE